ncbi:type II secretion system major pseudopilin GspG [Breoghania sp.]|uniref:type II secretion system major pseudopilin GspG n=1 Tax=Breoghania sp. TaxID=2065378 RepID=UPI002619B27B|nr:type II secretion system major pseudopilin GspG [Breoghania sp.]MDJ0929784.1 type II secretion system major pseudopilin GspG [Breoghania sp.]
MIVGEMPPSGEARQSRRYRRRRSARRGFSFLEVLVVLAIIALVASVVGPRAITYFSRAKTKTAALQIKEIESALELYFLDTGRYPGEDTGLLALVAAPPAETRWNGPYLKQASALTDPWNWAYRYRYPGQHAEFDVYSFGRDGLEGGSGEDADVGNW